MSDKVSYLYRKTFEITTKPLKPEIHEPITATRSSADDVGVCASDFRS